jgi:chitodextrinase
MAVLAGNGMTREASATGSPTTATSGSRMVADLRSLTATNWARVAGDDNGRPSRVNGHDEFVQGWLQRARSALRSVPMTTFMLPFATPGFEDLRATSPAADAEVVIPGTSNASTAVVVGCHPDGEPDSKGSVFDDASGCVIMLGAMRTLGSEWRRSGGPSVTVEFVLFDAEEQGLFGSEAYVAAAAHGALMPRPLFMIDEEQSGVGYPARPFGMVTKSTLPIFAILTPPLPDLNGANMLTTFKANGVHWRQPSRLDLSVAHSRVSAAITGGWTAMHKVYPRMPYRGGSRAAFTVADRGQAHISIITPGYSDNSTFEALGLPTVTLSGDATAGTPAAPDWAYPYDTPSDTFSTLACDTTGAPTNTRALGVSLDLEREITVRLVDRYAPPHQGQQIAILSAVPGADVPTTFAEAGASTATWDFGDGGHTAGATASHTYRSPGRYTVTVTGEKSRARRTITVPGHRLGFHATILIQSHPTTPWNPPELRSVPGCH